MLRITAISDTHNLHEELTIAPTDVLIHCGDWTMRGRPREVRPFLQWLDRQPATHKLLICGNHEVEFGECTASARHLLVQTLAPSVTYLEDEAVTIDGVNFWGSPRTPLYGNWAFMHDPPKMRKKWDLIPLNTHVLITHGPPRGILDTTEGGADAGCAQLRNRLSVLPELRLHAFGHIHECGGRQVTINKTVHANVASTNTDYQIVRQAYEVTI